MWKDWQFEQHEKRMRVLKLANSLDITQNLRGRSRHNYEQAEVERKHQSTRSYYFLNGLAQRIEEKLLDSCSWRS